MLVVLIGVVIADHLQGAIFPDDFYCVVGAGNYYVVPGRTEATSWSANNGFGAGRPECATRWAQFPASSKCSHGTLWEAVRSKIKTST